MTLPNVRQRQSPSGRILDPAFWAELPLNVETTTAAKTATVARFVLPKNSAAGIAAQCVAQRSDAAKNVELLDWRFLVTRDAFGVYTVQDSGGVKTLDPQTLGYTVAAVPNGDALDIQVTGDPAPAARVKWAARAYAVEVTHALP